VNHAPAERDWLIIQPTRDTDQEWLGRRAADASHWEALARELRDELDAIKSALWRALLLGFACGLGAALIMWSARSGLA
jgi:hypothetical protein